MNPDITNLINNLLNETSAAMDELPGSQRRFFQARIQAAAQALAQGIAQQQKQDQKPKE